MPTRGAPAGGFGKTLTLKDRLKEVSKPKPWSHQEELTKLVGKSIGIRFTNLEVEYGLLLAADQFSVMIALSDRSNRVFFKSQIHSFWAA